jgi:hypothetical protein
MEHRRFHRVKSTAQGDLSHQGITYRVRLENLSQRGALLSSDDCIMIPENDQCTLSFQFDESEFVVTAEVMHTFFSMVGVRFAIFEKGSEDLLSQLLRRFSDAPDAEPNVVAPGVAPPGKARLPLPSKSCSNPSLRGATETGREAELVENCNN